MLVPESIFMPEMSNDPVSGSGSQEDPYIIVWNPQDGQNPLNMPRWRKFAISFYHAYAFLCVTFASSALSAADPELQETFAVSKELVTTETALFVLAFAVGPMFFGPLSELYGRRIVCIVSYGSSAVFSGATAASKDIWTLLALRFLTGMFGASVITSSGGALADIYLARDRAFALPFVVGIPFIGSTIGPIVCAQLATSTSWRWVAALISLLISLAFIGSIFIPETCHSVLLRRRAKSLTRLHGKVYESKLDLNQAHQNALKTFHTTLLRPCVMLYYEPIVLLLSLYLAIIYGTTYMEFTAFPIIFGDVRHWTRNFTGLSFIGILVGQTLAVLYSALDNIRYRRALASYRGAFPELRLVPSFLAALLLPIGLFEFAWTNDASIHWAVCQVGTIFLGFSQIVIFLSVINYLIDTYTLNAASALAANTAVRSLFGAAFPLFTNKIYTKIGIHWASSIPAFLSLICAPLPFLFYAYGSRIRDLCKYAAESIRITAELQRNTTPASPQH